MNGKVTVTLTIRRGAPWEVRMPSTPFAAHCSMLLKTQDSINNISYSINKIYPGSINSNEEFFMYVQKLMNYIASVQSKLGDPDSVFQNFTDLQSQVAMLATENQQLKETITKLNGTIQMLTMAATVAQQQDQK